jgi:hypothetical protein
MMITGLPPLRFRADEIAPVSGTVSPGQPREILTGKQFAAPLKELNRPGGRARFLQALGTARTWLAQNAGATGSDFVRRLNLEIAALQPPPTELQLRWSITRVLPKSRAHLDDPTSPRGKALTRLFEAKHAQPVDVDFLHAGNVSPLLKAEVLVPVSVPLKDCPVGQELGLDVDLWPVAPEETDHSEMFKGGVKTRQYFGAVDTMRQYVTANILPVVTERLGHSAQQSPQGLTLAEIRTALTTTFQKDAQAAPQPAVTQTPFGVITVFDKAYNVSVNPRGIEWRTRSTRG